MALSSDQADHTGPTGPSPNRAGVSAAQLCALVAITVSSTFGVPLADLHAASRGPRSVAFARQSAMYLARVVFGLSLSEIGRAFGRDRTTAAYACRLIENLRDDAEFDEWLGALERCCGTLAMRAAGARS